MIIPEVITARNEVGTRLCFLHVSVILFIGGYPSMHCRWYPSMPCRFPGLHRGEVEESGQGSLQTNTQEGSLGVWPGGSPGPNLEGVSRPIPRGRLGGLAGKGGFQAQAWGVQAQAQGVFQAQDQGGAPGPGVCVCVCMYPSMHMETPPSRRLLLWTVRILLECILVVKCHRDITKRRKFRQRKN